MFLITNKSDASQAFQFLIKEMGLQAAVYDFHLYDHTFLMWASLKPSDNLTMYANGFVVGRDGFDQPHSTQPYDKKGELLPDDINPLLNSLVVRRTGEGFEVKPVEQASVYYSKTSVSDFTLLISLVDNLEPSLNGVGMLLAAGYFLGNATLFEGIRRVCYLRALSLPEFSEVKVSEWEIGKSNDQAMMQRFVDVIPPKAKTAISLSSGMDSRFVLGLMLRKNHVPKAYSLDGYESDLIQQLCNKLNMTLEQNMLPRMDSYSYAIRTDARIYDRGGNYHRMIGDVMCDEFIFNGLCAEPALKNTYKAVWKNPISLFQDVHNRIIEVVYLGYLRKEIDGFLLNRSQLKQYLTQELSFMRNETHLRKAYQITRLYDHYNSSINWAQAHTADLSFLRYPVFLLANKGGVELGISSPLLANFNYDRLRIMNQQLYPQLNLDYSDGRKFLKKRPVFNGLYLVYKEFVKAPQAYLKFRKKKMKHSPGNVNSEVAEPECAADFCHYFDRKLDLLLKAPVLTNVKRSAITLNNVLLFQEKYKASKASAGC